MFICIFGSLSHMYSQNKIININGPDNIANIAPGNASLPSDSSSISLDKLLFLLLTLLTLIKAIKSIDSGANATQPNNMINIIRIEPPEESRYVNKSAIFLTAVNSNPLSSTPVPCADH